MPKIFNANIRFVLLFFTSVAHFVSFKASEMKFLFLCSVVFVCFPLDKLTQTTIFSFYNFYFSILFQLIFIHFCLVNQNYVVKRGFSTYLLCIYQNISFTASINYIFYIIHILFIWSVKRHFILVSLANTIPHHITFC